MNRIFKFLGSVFAGGVVPLTPADSVKASYDSAQTNSQNENHWAAADGLDANSATDVATRMTLRERSRYESESNSYYRGLLETLSDDMIGTSPRLQLQLPNDENRSNSRKVEVAFANWSKSIGLAEKLRILDKTRRRDGEAFAVMIDNEDIPNRGLTNVKLDLKLYEADQVSDPMDYGNDPNYVDGVRYDDSGNVISYAFLPAHPGSSFYGLEKPTPIDAKYVIHWYKASRPGQGRGVPELQAALPLFAQLRRFTLATLSAAETAANIAGVLETALPAGTDPSYDASKYDRIPMARNQLLSLLAGQKLSQLKAEQPTSTYKEFKGEILNEIGRSVGAPFNIIAGNSSGYNYSSGRLDHVIYHRGVRVERHRFRERVLDRLFIAWVEEAAYWNEIPAKLPPIWEWSWNWMFDGFASIDPLKEANARAVDVKSGSTHHGIIFGEMGLDWEEQFEAIARIYGRAKELGIEKIVYGEIVPLTIAEQPEIEGAVAA